jgi:rhamnogalacturonan endolyase
MPTLCLLLAAGLLARPAERLDRGLCAVAGEAGTHISWRLLPADPADLGFSVYRLAADGTPRRLNAKPITATTDALDPDPGAAGYLLKAVRDGREGPELARCAGNDRPYLAWPLDGKDGVQKLGLGDLDGDGRLDFVLKRPDANIDPWHKYWQRSPGTYTLDAVSADGKLLWRRDMGWAIERGIWYSPYLVADLDGDGRAEVALKAGDGDPRDADGKVRSGAEWLVVLDGRNGRERARVAWPDREGFGADEAGYNYASRNQLAVACLDGQRLSLLALRGTYTVMKVDAYDLAGGQLRPRWRYQSDAAEPKYRGQGAHFTQAADLDADGRDEVILGSLVLDDDGKPLWCTKLGHPDALYLGDLDPRRPGLEVFYVMESRQTRNGLCLADARTGAILWGLDKPTKHVHSKGFCSDVDPLSPGSEGYGADSADHQPTGDRWLYAASGKLLSTTQDYGFGVNTAYWDADLQRELLRGGRVMDFGGDTTRGAYAGGVVMVADLVGDWREEIVTSVEGELRLYVTPEPAFDRRVTLLADPVYRGDVAMNANAYTQVPSHLVCFERVSPNLNLQVGLDGDPAAVRAVVVAPFDRPVRGTLKLTADQGPVTPAEVAIDVAPGERQVVAARRGALGDVRVTATFNGPGAHLAMTSPGEGLVPNGGMEAVVGNSVGAWTWWSRDNSGSAAPSTADPHGGRRCAALSFDGTADWAFTNSARRAVKPGQRVEARGWARSEACDELALAVVAYQAGKLVTWSMARAIRKGAHGWREFTAAATVPDGVDTIVVRWTGGGRTRVWLDDVSLRIAGGP